MMSQFYFALTNPETEGLLKEEVRLRYPGIRMSYSRPGFVTFKGERKEKFSPWFARVAGESLGKFKASELRYEKAWVWKREDDLIIPPFLEELSEKTRFRIGEMVTLIMMVGPDEFWVGQYELLPTHFQTPGEVSSILPREDVPSRAYFKIAEAYEAFDLPFDHQEIVLELGSAPGGASLFLLEQDLRVLGVDTAAMDPSILKKFSFKHMRRPFETLLAQDFPQGADWIVCDINLPPTVVMKEIWRLLDFLEPRGLLLTMKMNQAKHLTLLETTVAQLKGQGFQQVQLKYLPSHRQEICLYALRTY